MVNVAVQVGARAQLALEKRGEVCREKIFEDITRVGEVQISLDRAH